MADRSTRELDAGYFEAPLANAAVATKGEMACFDTSTGLVVPGKASTTLVPLGYFNPLSSPQTGDGVTVVGIKLFREARLHWWANDVGNPAVAANVGAECYILDSKTVTMTPTGLSRAGRIMKLDTTYGALVLMGPSPVSPVLLGGAITSVADRLALSNIAALSRIDQQLFEVATDGSIWRFVAASAVTQDGPAALTSELAITPAVGTGRFLRADKSFTMKLAIGFGTADAAVLSTVPAQMAVRLTGLPYYEVDTGFTGGAASAIGLSSGTNASCNVKGDLLGGAGGDVTATLGAAGQKGGTVGGKTGTIANQQAIVLSAADTLRFDRIVSAYTAGAGFICVPVAVAAVA